MNEHKVGSAKFGRVEQFSTTWCATLDPGTVFEPAYWREIAQQLKRRDIIRVFPADRSYFAELMVWQAAERWAQVTLLQKVPFDGPTVAALGSPGGCSPIRTGLPAIFKMQGDSAEMQGGARARAGQKAAFTMGCRIASLLREQGDLSLPAGTSREGGEKLTNQGMTVA